MQNRNDDDYWPPRPGSWEEAVDPYEVQWRKRSVKAKQDDQQDVPMKVLTEHRPEYGVPASV